MTSEFRMSDKSDIQLVKEAQKGSIESFDLLVIKYQNRLQSIISKYVSNFDDVPDIAQETFLKAYRALSSFRGDSEFYTWLYRIGVNTAKNYLVSKSRRPVFGDLEISENEHLHPEDTSTPENNLMTEELELLIKKSISNLPEDLRMAITLREYDALSYEEIASIMKCPVGTIRSRIFRAREIIDQIIDKNLSNE